VTSSVRLLTAFDVLTESVGAKTPSAIVSAKIVRNSVIPDVVVV
jgi:hypothetical protein